MSVSLSPIGGAGAQFFDNNGTPLSGGKLYAYDAGTTTPKTTYTSAAGTTPNSNPIILNAAGRPPSEIWLTTNEPYKFVLKDSADSLIGTWDNIYGYSSGSIAYAATEVQTAEADQTLFILSEMVYTPGTNTLAVFVDGVNQVVENAYVETSSTSVTFMSGLHVGATVKFVNVSLVSTDASLTTYEPGFTGSVATNVQAKLRESVSVLDFGAVGDGVTDDTAAIQAAIDAAVVQGYEVYFPPGVFKVSPQGANQYCLTLAKAAPNPALAQTTLRGSGKSVTNEEFVFPTNYGSTLYNAAPESGKPILNISTSRGVLIDGLNFAGENGKPVPGTTAITLPTANIDTTFYGCSFTNFESAITIEGVQNNDTITVEQCTFSAVFVAIRNAGVESYLIRANKNFFGPSCEWCFQAEPDGSGLTMAGIQLHQNMILVKQGLVNIEGVGLTLNIRGVVSIKNNVVEVANTTNPVVLRMACNDSGGNQFGFICEENTINLGDLADIYSPAFYLLDYKGAGPFSFSSNYVSSPRAVLRLNTYASSVSVGSARMVNNRFTNRPTIKYSTEYPALSEENNTFNLEASQAIGGGSVGTSFREPAIKKQSGKVYQADINPTVATLTLNYGAAWNIPSLTTGTPTSVFCREPGTWGSLTGVDATLVNGANSATITTAGADRLKMYGGCYIQIGASGRLLVADVVGDTIYLQSTYSGATQTTQAVNFYNYNLKQVCDYTNAAPTTGYWFQGDVAWKIGAAAGGVPGWVNTVTGDGATPVWKDMAALAV